MSNPRNSGTDAAPLGDSEAPNRPLRAKFWVDLGKHPSELEKPLKSAEKSPKQEGMVLEICGDAPNLCRKQVERRVDWASNT